MRWLVSLLFAVLFMCVAALAFLALSPTNSTPNPAVSVSKPGTATAVQQQRITNGAEIKVEAHPTYKSCATLVVLTVAEPPADTTDTTPQYRIVLIRGDANDITVHTNRIAGIPTEIFVTGNNDCSDGACAAATVDLFLHSLDELH